MRLYAAAALAVCLCPGLALAAPVAASLAAPSSAADAAADAAPSSQTGMRIAMRKEILPAHGKLAEERPTGERYLFVVSGRLKVSNLVTGDEQVVEAGKMAAERPGDWQVAEALGEEPVTLFVIDRTPAGAAAATTSVRPLAAGN